jgi:hypothetical protein
MRNMKRALTLAAAISLVLAAVTQAAGEQKFKTEGIIQRIAGDTILVRASAQDIEITKDAKTKVTGQLRRGAGATVFYVKVAGENHATEIIMGGNVSSGRTL